MAISKAAPLDVAGIQEEIASKADAQVHSGHRLPSGRSHYRHEVPPPKTGNFKWNF
jgi:hypothetical protein